MSYARLSETAPASADLTPMDAIQGQDLVLMSVEARETTYGRGYLLTLTSQDDNDAEVLSCLTSAVVVVGQVDKMLEANKGKFKPCIVRFEKSGRCWVIV